MAKNKICKTYHIYDEVYVGYQKRKEVCQRVIFDNIKTNYDVTRAGNIYNRKTKHKLAPCDVGGHYNVLIYYTDPETNHKTRKQFILHRLIAKAFIPNPKNKKEVHHIDVNPHNNHADNLMWVTNKEHNDIHMKLGKFQKIARYGEDNNFSKTSEVIVRKICEEFQKNELTPPQIAKKYNVSRKSVTLLLHKKRWRHITENMDFSMYDKLREVSSEDKNKALYLIKNSDLTLKEISEITGVSHTYVSHMNRALNLRKKNELRKSNSKTFND